MQKFIKHALDTMTPLMHSKGYIVAFYPVHPFAWKGSHLVSWHRLVVENRLGRYLGPHEIVHHKDDDKTNNKDDNLEVTSNGEHTREHLLERAEENGTLREFVPCFVCATMFKQKKDRNKYCSVKCSDKARAHRRPGKDELEKMLWTIPCSTIAELHEVSNSAVTKWCKVFGLKKPGRGYWQKLKSQSVA